MTTFDNLYHFTLKCGTQLTLSDLEQAGLSYVPCGQVDGEDQPLLKFGSLWGKRRQVRRKTYAKKWNAYTTKDMTGVQIMTGKPTFKRYGRIGYLYYTSLDIEQRMIENHPNEVSKIQKLYEDNIIGSACILKTKSNGLRLDAYTEYVGKKMSFKDAEKKMLFEVLADKCLARIDARYEILSGSILDMPTLPKKALQEIYHIISKIASIEQSDSKPREVVEKSQIGDLDIEWDSNGRSQLFPTEHCQTDSHTSNRDEVRFTKHPDGSVDGKCFNCGGIWWEIEPKKHLKRSDPQPHKKDVRGNDGDCNEVAVGNRWRVSEASPSPSFPKGLEPVKALPLDHPIIANAPSIEVRETPSFRHFSPEERNIVSDVLSLDPDAGWHGQTPVFTTRYEYLHPLTQKFALNGQPSDVEKRRVWNTMFGKCDICGAVTAQWIDRYLLTAGVYCDGCHKDYHLGSYLELELNRKLPNSIVSDYQGFLGDDPEFADFRLWQPGIMTHLGAGMATGKSTETYKRMIEFANQRLGIGIIVVPFVALARFLAHYLRGKYGYRSWGLWHEGCNKSEKFIGDFGAIVCLPSLPFAVATAENDGVSQLYIAIDEVDFGYNLLSLSVEQATAVKKCLRDALASTGFVVSGQTESTLSLEALAEELETDEIQGFYNTAKPADGHVVMHKHLNTEGKSTDILCGVIDDITDAHKSGHNAYTFCNSRRDGDVIADVFQGENPVIYNAYTKGNLRADAVLRNQKLTDSRLFIGTSAAGIGISILDPKAKTVIASGLNYGSRDASMSVQELVRDRGRSGGSYHYVDYNLSLPVSPTENENVSIYHEAVKQASSRSAHMSTAGIRKIAYAQALASLADLQIETFVSYHIGKVGNMPVYHASALDVEPERINAISNRRSELRRSEREKKIANAVELLQQRDILTSSEIRKASNKGRLSPDDRLAHEVANETSQAVGWNGEIDRFNGETFDDLLDDADIQVAIALVEKNINIDNLTKQRRGYWAVRFPEWTDNQFKSELEKSDSQLVVDGLGLEITAIHDDRFLGQMLKALLDRLTGKVFDATSLAEAVREMLQTTSASGKTFESEIVSGALGASAYRKARFLHCADGDRIIDWVRGFISEWYPARIAKNEDAYALCHAENWDLRLASFKRWLTHQTGVPDGTELDLYIFEATELPDPDAEIKSTARFRRETGETIKDIAESLDRHPNTISKWCDGIKSPSPAQREVLSILGDGKVWKTSDIEAHSRFAGRNVKTALKTLSDAGTILKIKRGHYQKT